jgi:hypothetical protein
MLLFLDACTNPQLKAHLFLEFGHTLFQLGEAYLYGEVLGIACLVIVFRELELGMQVAHTILQHHVFLAECLDHITLIACWLGGRGFFGSRASWRVSSFLKVNNSLVVMEWDVLAM